MAAGGGSQCGYCTPGFVVSLFAEHIGPNAKDLAARTNWEGIFAAAPDTGLFAMRRCRWARRQRVNFSARLARPAPSLDELRFETGGARFSRPRV